MKVAFASILLMCISGASIAQDACTKELIEERDRRLPEVIDIANPTDFIAALEQIYDCNFDLSQQFPYGGQNDALVFDGQEVGLVEWYAQSDEARGGAYAVVNFGEREELGRVAVEIAELARIGDGLVALSGVSPPSSFTLELLQDQEIGFTSLQDSEAYPGAFFPALDFSVAGNLTPGVDFTSNEIIVSDLQTEGVNVGFGSIINWLLPPKKTTVLVESIPSAASVMFNGREVTTTNRTVWATRDAISEFEIQLDGFQACDSNDHVVIYQDRSPFIRVSCILQRSQP